MNASSARVLAVGIASIGLAAAGCQPREPEAGTAAPAAELAAVPLYDNLGAYQRPISAANAEAQQYFDQGMRLTYAFNHAEAVRAFEEATRRDPGCAMCYWGIANALGPNINAPMDASAVEPAFGAVQQAVSLAPRASEVERALIEAAAKRYVESPPEDRSSLDKAYAAAMADVRARFPEDADVLTLHAEAVMNLSPWDYWTRQGEPRPGTAELVADLERVLAKDPDHPGACHYYIHAVEAVQPKKAVACAERLASLMPGAGHLVHMPAHIYIRVGRWADAITANEHAVHTDESYIRDQRPTGVYPLAYYPHNYHFLSFAATMAGRSGQAIQAARSLASQIDMDVARAVPMVEAMVPFVHLTLLTFGRFDEVVSEPLPPSDLRMAFGLAQYARGTALAATAQAAQAKVALDTVSAIASGMSDPLSKTILEIAQHALAGEIAQRGGDLKGAESHYRQAMAREDELLYMEPPHWYYPIRHSLGAVLLTQGRGAEAEQVFLRDLERFPENTWSLHGLQASLRAQGRTADADAINARIAKLGGDVQLTTSRL
ncbi:MAG TPA: hypothetical protein VK939_00040 [Longimicrobiales bacterium]|nr:hypothetical protein [Longimicrobiales bacterium]